MLLHKPTEPGWNPIHRISRLKGILCLRVENVSSNQWFGFEKSLRIVGIAALFAMEQMGVSKPFDPRFFSSKKVKFSSFCSLVANPGIRNMNPVFSFARQLTA